LFNNFVFHVLYFDFVVSVAVADAAAVFLVVVNAIIGFN